MWARSAPLAPRSRECTTGATHATPPSPPRSSDAPPHACLPPRCDHRGIRETRYYKSVGLGIKTPRTAIEGTYVDKKCPWTGNVNIRGKMLTGVVKTTKMKNTLIVRKDYLHYIKKYQRFEKRHKNTPVHVSPAFRVKVGDEILAGQCRPLSKTVRFNMLKVLRSAGGDKKGFSGA